VRRALALLTLSALALPSIALAHGRPAFIGAIAFHPNDRDTIVARATFGLVLSEDHGATWRWICAAVTDADPTREDPAILVAPDGSVLVGTFSGLARSTPDRCEFTPVGGNLDDVFVIDLDARRADPGVVYAVATSGVDPDVLMRSDDEGRTFSPLSETFDLILLEKVRVAPSDAMRVYLSGAIPATPRQGFFLRSIDGGESFIPIEIVFEDGERNVHVLAVDPSNPDRVLVRVTRSVVDPMPERLLLTENGGDTFTTVLRAQQITGAAFSEDGAAAWATSRTSDGMFRSGDGGRTFAPLFGGNLPCVASRAGELWFCADQPLDGYAMGLSGDGGDTLDEVLRFDQIVELPTCPRCSEVGYVCPQWFPDLAYDLMLDAGIDLGDGSVTGTPRDAAPPAICTDGSEDLDAGIGMDAGMGDGGTCNCRAAGRGVMAHAGLSTSLSFALFALCWRRRRARGRTRW
jgi:hypothetical protein